MTEDEARKILARDTFAAMRERDEKMAERQRLPILVLDFDGVVHEYKSPWTRADEISDGPVLGALEFIREAQEHFEVHILSSRTALDGGLYAMQKWLMHHMGAAWGPKGMADVYGQVQWPQDKPPAFLTIDDRAIQFTGTWPDPQALKAFKPWNKA
jgi:hypothetical protein